LRERFTFLEGAYLTNKTATNFAALVNSMFEVARKVDALVGAGAGAVGDAGLKTVLKNLITSTLKGIYTTLIGHDKELKDKVTAAPAYTAQFDTGTVPSAAEWGTLFGVGAPAASTVIPAAAASNADKMDTVLPLLRALFDQINSAWLGSVASAAQELETKKHEGLVASFPLYNTILVGIQNTNTHVPPSGAVAGIYAYVDRTRGVWKAPANVSISGIIGPKDTFTASELDALNVDVNSGKSINAIRSFTGKGTLVFGARTLTGNDNEWRYVSVRRFFNFVEESSKKATEQFVFEPNDANTWVRVQAMIENFLTVLWRQGALQGIKPEHAFYVAVGLGKTMTPLDILEGRMIIEIGMAVVRPAEFIILRFSHKMAES
jgi:phage tail sheath protein FI